MYKNLKTEMARAGMKRAELAEAIGVEYLTLSLKLNGKRDFKLQEAISIKRALGSELSIEELFAKG